MQRCGLVFVEPPDDDESLKRFCGSLHKFTQFQTFQELATLTYGDPTSNCCIVSSIEFDRDGEYFAVAGVTKKIKVCTMLSQICGCVLLCVHVYPRHGICVPQIVVVVYIHAHMLACVYMYILYTSDI